MEILCDYINQATLDVKINLHCVSYEISNHIVNVRKLIDNKI